MIVKKCMLKLSKSEMKRENGMKLKTMKREEITGSEVYLVDTHSVETTFQRTLNWNKDAFWDETSLALMAEIDHAKREGDYGVVTHIGESCITCLSTGCKFGLLVLYYSINEPHLRIIVKSGAAGINVWNWLFEHTDVTIYAFPDNLGMGWAYCDKLIIEHEGITYNNDDKGNLFHVLSDCENLPYKMTKEAEANAYENHVRYRRKAHFCDVARTEQLEDFIRRIPDAEDFFGRNTELEQMLAEYRVTNYLNYIPLELPCRRHPLYICGEKKGQIECSKVNSVKYPSFLELFFYDILEGDYFTIEGIKQELHKFRDEYESWFALVLDGNEICKIEDYPKETLFGVEVDVSNASITIYDPVTAVEHFHELYQKSEPVGWG